VNNEKDRKYYDEAFMEVFTNVKIVKSLLEDFIKEEWVELIDFSSMESAKSVFKGINDSKRESDLLIKFKLTKKKPANLYIFVLMEFQSKAEPMILRLLEYLTRIYKKQKTDHNTLYPVVPIVIYNGKEQWKELNSFIEHFPLISDDIKKYIPDFKYILIDIARFGDNLLESLKDAVSFFFLLDKTDIRKKDKAASRIIGILRKLQGEDPEIFKLLGRYITGLLKYKEAFCAISILNFKSSSYLM
jgi:predicted transposase/invertase (TIGR01784 family)